MHLALCETFHGQATPTATGDARADMLMYAFTVNAEVQHHRVGSFGGRLALNLALRSTVLDVGYV